MSYISRLSDADKSRFWQYVDRRGNDECWEWKKACDKDGYGHFRFALETKKVNLRANRVAYFLTFPEADQSKIVCHRCDNRRCCNPYHLFLGTWKDNIQDALKKGRFRIGEDCVTSKLKEADALAILSDPRPYYVIAADYSVSTINVSLIKRRKAWRHLSDEGIVKRPAASERRGESVPTAKLTEQMVIEIRSSSLSLRKLAKQFGVSRGAIEAVKYGKTWKHITTLNTAA